MAKSKQTPNNLILEAKPRAVFGKKLRRLRREGLIPANVFGPDFKSKSVTVILADFIKTYKIAKETGVVYLQLDNENIPVLIRQVQRHPVKDTILHIDFRKIDLNKKVETAVPVKIINQSEAVIQKGGILLTLSETLLVEALPQDIPSQIEVDISKITDVGQEIKVANLPQSEKYEIKTPAEKVIVSVVAHKEESITPETTVVAPEVTAEKPKEGEEAAAPAQPAATSKIPPVETKKDAAKKST